MYAHFVHDQRNLMHYLEQIESKLTWPKTTWSSRAPIGISYGLLGLGVVGLVGVVGEVGSGGIGRGTMGRCTQCKTHTEIHKHVGAFHMNMKSSTANALNPPLHFLHFSIQKVWCLAGFQMPSMLVSTKTFIGKNHDFFFNFPHTLQKDRFPFYSRPMHCT